MPKSHHRTLIAGKAAAAKLRTMAIPVAVASQDHCENAFDSFPMLPLYVLS
eukprot:COSAG06_NODE_39319_length_414_cov_0.593651_1_plen_50_part_10